jgi:predicted DNA-binding transcriptional regulator AlpA
MSDVLFIEDVAQRLGMSVRTIQKRLRANAFPIPEVPSLDRKRRWSPTAVDKFLASQKQTKASEPKPGPRLVQGGRRA